MPAATHQQGPDATARTYGARATAMPPTASDLALSAQGSSAARGARSVTTLTDCQAKPLSCSAAG